MNERLGVRGLEREREIETQRLGVTNLERDCMLVVYRERDIDFCVRSLERERWRQREIVF